MWNQLSLKGLVCSFFQRVEMIIDKRSLDIIFEKEKSPCLEK